MSEDRTACAKARRDLLDCLWQSDCVQKEGHTPRECMEGKNATMPEECQQYRYALFDCKRSQLDMRTRFRGKKDYGEISK